MEQPEDLASLRDAYALGEIDGATYRAVRRALVTAIAQGVIPASPLRPTAPVRTSDEQLDNEEDFTSLPDVVPVIESAPVPVVPRSIADNKASDRASPVEHSSPRPTSVRLPVVWLAGGGILTGIAVLTAAWMFFLAPDPAAQVASVPEHGATDDPLRQSRERLMRLASKPGWGAQDIQEVLAVLGTLAPDDSAVSEFRARATRELEQAVELAAIGNVDPVFNAALLDLGRRVGITDPRFDALADDKVDTDVAEGDTVAIAASSQADDDTIAPATGDSENTDAAPVAATTAAAAATPALQPLEPPAIAVAATVPSPPADNPVTPHTEVVISNTPVPSPPQPDTQHDSSRASSAKSSSESSAKSQEVATAARAAKVAQSTTPARPDPKLKQAVTSPNDQATAAATGPTKEKTRQAGAAAPSPVIRPAGKAGDARQAPMASTAVRPETRPTPARPATTASPVAQQTASPPRPTRSLCDRIQVRKTRARNCQDDLIAGGHGPSLVVIPEGRFVMGGERSDESPKHEVVIGQSLAVGRFEITVAEYDQFARANGQALPPQVSNDPQMPVVNVSWAQAAAYANWLSAQTGATYRLPSEAEWEYFARAGVTTRWPDGDDSISAQIIGSVLNKRSKPEKARSNPANAFQVVNALGNVREWTLDAWQESFAGAPTDGSPVAGSGMRVVRGGSFEDDRDGLRLSSRIGLAEGSADGMTGFRVVREIHP